MEEDGRRTDQVEGSAGCAEEVAGEGERKDCGVDGSCAEYEGER